jgi:hypothetical protein
MKIYNYDPGTFQYIGDSIAFESPLEPGVFLIPANATETPVPTYNPANQQCHWIGGEWVISATVADVPPQPTAEELQAAAWQEYQAKAKAMLSKSDLAILRCVESGIQVPTAWATYRKALRGIAGAASGDPTQPLPETPAFPSGT